ncbi:alpha/beta hydrolase-fold protein [Gemmatimonas sp.]|uniref:alpha/beta hydrolase-fold protein n=1 Tax=Gemmatimonas sp. TaxID=1962908 RepID=UPI003983A7FB
MVGPQLEVSASLGSNVVIEGSTGPGSLYKMVKPANWNGTLLVYAHGSTGAEDPVALPIVGERFVNALTQEGVAVAFSSFSESGWNIKDGAQRTHQLNGLFTSKFGQPTTTFVAGQSMGGLIAIKLAEDYPTQYAGSLPICSVAGGTRRQADYDANVWALFDYYYPGVLPGNAAALPPGVDWFTDIALPAVNAMYDNRSPVSKIIAITQTPVPGIDFDHQVRGIYFALGLNQFFLGSLVPNGNPYFDNASTQYTSATLPASELQTINAGIARYRALPSTLNGMNNNYTPSGKLKRPMLMLSGSFDPNVPAFNQAAYLAAATSAGSTQFLLQRTLPSEYHCTYPFSDVVSAFHDLVQWSRTGVKPAT